MPPGMMAEGGKNRDGETGRYVQSVSDADILTFLAENELVGSGDVADRFEFTLPTAYRRLKALEEEGRVESRTVGGGNSLIWTLADEESEV